MAGDVPAPSTGAVAAGCKPHFVASGKHRGDDVLAIARLLAGVPGVHVHADLAAFAEALIQSERAARSEAGRPQSGYGHLE